MRIQLAYTVTALGAGGIYSVPLNAAGAAIWAQFAHHPANILAAVQPVVHEKLYLDGWVDTDQASAANGFAVLVSDDAVTTRTTITLTIPLNAAGDGTTFRILLPGGKYIRLTYTNGAIAQTRFALLANLAIDE